jgi:HlyD family secretion protein
MRNKILSIFFFGVLALSLSACGTPATVKAEAESTPAASPAVISEGNLLPVRTVELSFFPSGGVVSSVDKTAGQTVSAGDVIASLELTPQQSAAITAAQQELVQAQNALQKFQDEATVSKDQAAYDLALAKEKFNDAMDKKRDKQHTYKYSKTRESKVELDKALSNYDLTEAQVALAEKELAKWANGPDPVQLAELQARVDNALAQLASAKAAGSEQLTLTAPWAGTIITNDLVVGQTASAGTAHVQLADENAWIVETDDLKETYISAVKVGQTARITVDALPGREFTGTVTTIEGIGVDKNGDITYKVTLSIPADPAFKWNMTVNVEFATQ